MCQAIIPTLGKLVPLQNGFSWSVRLRKAVGNLSLCPGGSPKVIRPLKNPSIFPEGRAAAREPCMQPDMQPDTQLDLLDIYVYESGAMRRFALALVHSGWFS